MKVLTYENYEVTIAPEALQLSVFRDIWERDKSEDKHIARMELSYIFFMEDVRSDYLVTIDQEQRSKDICKDMGFPAKWKADQKINEALEFYRSKQPIQAKWLESERLYIDKLEQTMRVLDPARIDEGGRLVNPLTQTTELVTKLNKAIIDYTNTEKAVFSEMQKEEKIRGSQEKAYFENLDNV